MSYTAIFNPRGYQQITDLSASVGLTVPDGATRAVIQAEGDDVRWRDDGTDPTATVGMILAQNTSLDYSGDLNEIEFIEAAGGGILNVTYY